MLTFNTINDILELIKQRKEVLKMLLTKNEVYEMEIQQYGDETEVLEVGVDRVLTKIIKGSAVEYAVLRYNNLGLFNGSYYSTFATPEREAKDLVKTKFREMV